MSPNTVGYTESVHYSALEDLEQTYTLKTINPLLLAYCGKEDCTPGWCFGPYIRENYVIHVVTRGTGVYKVRGKEYRVTAGQMFIIYPGEETIYQADEEDPWSYKWIGFNGYRAETIAEEIGFTPEEPVLTLQSMEELSAAIDSMLEARELTNANLLRRMAALYDALAIMIESGGNVRPVEKYNVVSYVSMALTMISESYDKKIRISEIADRLGINRSYLTSIFKQELKISPQAFLINYRLEKASNLLMETQESIGKIASSVGYTDTLSFSKAFKQKYGVSPSEYRNSSVELALIEEKGKYTSIHKL